jgi:hypothetical protein
VFANDRHESDSERRGTPIARVTRQTAAMPVKAPCTDESRAFSTREVRGCRAGWTEMTVLRSARACITGCQRVQRRARAARDSQRLWPNLQASARAAAPPFTEYAADARAEARKPRQELTLAFAAARDCLRQQPVGEPREFCPRRRRDQLAAFPADCSSGQFLFVSKRFGVLCLTYILRSNLTPRAQRPVGLWPLTIALPTSSFSGRAGSHERWTCTK